MIKWYRRWRRRARAQADVQATLATLQDLDHAFDLGRLTRAEYWPAKAALEIRLARQRAAIGSTHHDAVEFARTGRNWSGSPTEGGRR